MQSHLVRQLVSFACFTMAFTGLVSGQVLYSESFDDSTADVKINQQPDTFATYVDYSNMTVGTTNFSIPEAPRPVMGGASTRGILLQANVTSNTLSAINVLAGATPISFSGDYRMSYDVYLSVPNDVVAPFPDIGSTEQLLWGVGTDDAGPLEARQSRGVGAIGTWGWLANENGYGTEDAAINENDTELADLGDTQLGEDHFFNDAFTMPATPTAPNDAPANQWVRVDIEVLGGSVSVKYNDVEFFDRPSAATTGFAMLGYEDPFATSAAYTPGNNPNFPGPFPVADWMWGIFDNFTVEVIPEPASATLCTIGVLLLIARRRR